MKISLEWLRDYVEIPAEFSIRRVAHDLTMSTVEVEGTEDLARLLDHIVVARVSAVVPGTRADVVTCDIGSGQVTIVSVQRNLTAGQRVAVALPGARLVSGNDGAGESTLVAAREIDGVASEGVLCTTEQLGLAALFPAAGKGALVLSDADTDAGPGTPLADAVGWNDTILEIDNKSLTNRPDLWGHYGIARELAAIYRLPLKPLPAPPAPGTPLPLVDPAFDARLCRRFFAARIAFEPAPSPLWLRSRLARVGQASRGLAVDLTNYVMFAVGQPCHAYDADRLALPLSVRAAQPDEKAVLLDGREVVLQPPMPVIVDQRGIVAAAGLMGGGPSAVGAATRDVVLEIANFDAMSVRRMAATLNLRTEGSSRFEKAVDSWRVDEGRAVFFDALARSAPGSTLLGSTDVHPRPTAPITIDVGVEFLQKRLGSPMPREEIRARLESVGFAVACRDASLEVGVPSWRATGDVSLPEDVLEEIARLHGYENFTYVAPRVALHRLPLADRKPIEQRLRELCARVGGLHEVVSYPWSQDASLDAAGLADAVHVALATPPGPDKRWLRPSLVPGIVERVVENLRYATDFGLFEIGRVFPRGDAASLSDARERLPYQPRRLAGAFVGENAEQLFVAAKGLLEELGRAFGTSLRFERGVQPPWGDSGASVGIVCGDVAQAGFLAVLGARTRRLAGMKRAVAVVFELHVDALPAAGEPAGGYSPLPLYPETAIDLSLIVAEGIAWSDIEQALRGGHELVREVSFVDLFRGRTIPPLHKSITLRLRLGHDARTLRSEEAAEVDAWARTTLKQRFDANPRQAESVPG